MVEAGPCRCLEGRRCAPAPNRCRKPMKLLERAVMLPPGCVSPERTVTPEEWAAGMDAALAALGEHGFEVLYCQDMQLHVMENVVD